MLSNTKSTKHNFSLKIPWIASVFWVNFSSGTGLWLFCQPHILVRFMAIRSVNDLPSARRIGMSWMIISVIGALGVGFSGLASVNPMVLPLMIQKQFLFYYQSYYFIHWYLDFTCDHLSSDYEYNFVPATGFF